MSRVISRPTSQRVTLDAGSKGLAAEAGSPVALVLGRVVGPDALVALGPSEEVNTLAIFLLLVIDRLFDSDRLLVVAASPLRLGSGRAVRHASLRAQEGPACLAFPSAHLPNGQHV
jgi:hypothetical protein